MRLFTFLIASLIIISSGCNRKSNLNSQNQTSSELLENDTISSSKPETKFNQDIDKSKNGEQQPSSINTQNKTQLSSDPVKNMNKMIEIVSDPNYDIEKFKKGIPLVASLKEKLLARDLVRNLNAATGLNFSEDGGWTVAQINYLLYQVVLAPGYDEEIFLSKLNNY